MFNKTVELHGGVDVLINNAGYSGGSSILGKYLYYCGVMEKNIC